METNDVMLYKVDKTMPQIKHKSIKLKVVQWKKN